MSYLPMVEDSTVKGVFVGACGGLAVVLTISRSGFGAAIALIIGIFVIGGLVRFYRRIRSS